MDYLMHPHKNIFQHIMDVVYSNSDYKILIVDDIIENILLLTFILSHENYQLLTATSAKNALEVLKNDIPDVILLDVMMPDMDGFELTQIIRKMPEPYCDITIIFLTALDLTDSIVKGFQVGGNDFITKDFKKEELLIRIKHQISLIATKRMLAQKTEALEQSIHSRDKMYSVIAHDLLSPMGYIKMILNMLLVGIPKGQMDDKMYEMLHLVNKSVEDTFILLDNLLKWTKSQTGKLHVIMQQVELNPICEGQIQVFNKMAKAKNIQFILDATEPTDVFVDKNMLKSILRNLMSNALKFSSPNSSVVLRINNDPDNSAFLTISVEDHGCGIELEAQQKLMKIETHYSTFGTNNEEGSGLGLLLCQDFVQKIGGKLWFESTPKVGTTFSFTVPKVLKS